jgi:hypothetical protein
MAGSHVIWASACFLALAQASAAAALVEEVPLDLLDYHEPDEAFDLVHGYGVQKKEATFRTVKVTPSCLQLDALTEIPLTAFKGL